MASSTTASEMKLPLGAYGLRVAGLRDAGSLLAPASPGWPLVEIVVDVGDLEADGEHLDDQCARLRLKTGGWIELERDPGRARYVVHAPIGPDALVHPYLAPAAAVFAHWHGREGLHGGALALGHTAWGVIGDRLGGKSSLLAALALSGTDIVCDDVLVVEGRAAYVGPRTVDLREDAAVALGAGEAIAAAGTRRRWRLRLPALDRPLKLGGWVFTVWSDQLELRRLPAAETLARLYRNRSITVPPKDPAAFLQLSVLPAWELRRPRSWSSLTETLELLLGALGDG